MFNPENRDKVLFWKSVTRRQSMAKWLDDILSDEFPAKKQEILNDLLRGDIEAARKDFSGFIDNWLGQSIKGAVSDTCGSYGNTIEYVLHENFAEFGRGPIEDFLFYSVISSKHRIGKVASEKIQETERRTIETLVNKETKKVSKSKVYGTYKGKRMLGKPIYSVSKSGSLYVRLYSEKQKKFLKISKTTKKKLLKKAGV